MLLSFLLTKRGLKRVVVDLFYHSRHGFWIVNPIEDTVLVWMSAKLVLEHNQMFAVNLNSGIGVGEDMGTGPERTAGIQGNEIGQLDMLGGSVVSGLHRDLHGVRNEVVLLRMKDHPYIRCV